MRVLETGSASPIGRYVDKIVRTKPGVLKGESYLKKTIPQIAWKKAMSQRVCPLRESQPKHPFPDELCK